MKNLISVNGHCPELLAISVDIILSSRKADLRLTEQRDKKGPAIKS